jgi:hypothetical protein
MQDRTFLRGTRDDDQLLGRRRPPGRRGRDHQNDGGDGVDTFVKPGIDDGAVNREA